MENIHGVANPKVGIINIGAEEEKGNALVKETFPMLKEDPNITIDEGSGATVYFLAMNGRREWTNNKKLM